MLLWFCFCLKKFFFLILSWVLSPVFSNICFQKSLDFWIFLTLIYFHIISIIFLRYFKYKIIVFIFIGFYGMTFCLQGYYSTHSVFSYNNFVWDSSIIFFWCSFLNEMSFPVLSGEGQKIFSCFIALELYLLYVFIFKVIKSNFCCLLSPCSPSQLLTGSYLYLPF